MMVGMVDASTGFAVTDEGMIAVRVDPALKAALVAEAQAEDRSMTKQLERILRERYATLAERETSGQDSRTRSDSARVRDADGGNSGTAEPESAASVGASRSASAATANRGATKQRGAGANGKTPPRAATSSKDRCTQPAKHNDKGFCRWCP